MPEIDINQNLYIRGTGRWYHGQSYSAKVVDIREEDDTVKIRYLDGGFKRFKRSELQALIIDPKTFKNRNSIVDVLQSYELSPDQYDAGISSINQLDSQVNAAIAARDFKLAQELQDQIDHEVETIQKTITLEDEIKEAIVTRDFEKAAVVQKEIDILRKDINGEEKDDKPVVAPEVNWGEILDKAKNRALGSGGAGATAMVIQVCSLMWMRTIMNYQYRYGTTTRQAAQALYKQGGIPRFYRGISPALLQGPLSRFGDTAANTGVLTLMNSHPDLIGLPVQVKTILASFCAASLRVCLMPIDTVKTTLQVEGKDGLKLLRAKIARSPTALWHGSLGAMSATFVGHYPWFATYNVLQEKIPAQTTTGKKLLRNAGIGFCSSFVSDTCSNSIRVLKTYRQTSSEKISYPQAARNIIASDGVMGLFGRGLKTRLIANGAQGVMFSVLWKYFDEKFSNKT